MSTKQPLNKNRFKGLRIPWRKNINKILRKSDVDNVDDRQSVISDLKRDNKLLAEDNSVDKIKIPYFFDGPFGIDTYKKIVDDYYRGWNVGSNRSDDALSKSLQRGELVNLQKSTMRKQLPNENDENYLKYQLAVNHKYTNKSNEVEHVKVDQPPSLTNNVPLHLSHSEDNQDARLLTDVELKTWGDALDNLKNQLQTEYEEELDQGSDFYDEVLSNSPEEYDANISFHSAQLQREDLAQKEVRDDNIQMYQSNPTTITVNWNNCKLNPHGDDYYPDPGDSSQSFNRTLKNILCDEESKLTNDVIIGKLLEEDKIGKVYFSEKVLPQMVECEKVTRIRHSTDSSHPHSPNMSHSHDKVDASPLENSPKDEQNVLRQELHRVNGEINELKSLCLTFAKNMASLSNFQEDIKKLFEKKFPDLDSKN